uniref:Uncharacterized protein n=1 Tax=Parascaris equorum TaxID=6256 RepID=A0A914R7N9_PAREQ
MLAELNLFRVILKSFRVAIAADAVLYNLSDKYTRALADTENVRRRGQKQVEDAKLFAIQGFCKDLLEVADILDLAVGSIKKDVEANPQIKSLHEGVEMTRTVLEK